MEGVEVTISHLGPHPTEEGHYRVGFVARCVANDKTQSFLALVNVEGMADFNDDAVAKQAWESVAPSVAVWHDRVKDKSSLVGKPFDPAA